MGKKICSLAKKDYISEHLTEYVKLMNQPKFVCKKCGHVANDDDLLCKSEKI